MNYFFTGIGVSLIALLFASGCTQEQKEPKAIFRSKADERVPASAQANKVYPVYPWNDSDSPLKAITKEFLRCKGSSLNPPYIIYENGKEKDRIWDCGGFERHGLPVRNGQEYIYPVLLELLNFVQSSLQKRVIVTSGHRCPSHEQYIDEKHKTASTKHLIGGAVSFFIEGYETQMDKVVQEIIRYYALNPLFSGKKEYVEFSRNPTSDTQTAAWANKEVLVKVYLPNEGRNLDNRHPFPYLDIQVRFDRELNKPVACLWQDAQTYLRK